MWRKVEENVNKSKTLQMKEYVISQPYTEPTKIAARTQALSHAVELLTTRRGDAAIVPADYVERVKARLLASEILGDKFAGKQCNDVDINSWKTFRKNSLGELKPDELTVAYLAGPQPSNDLQTLIELGLRAENIWAFEVNAEAISNGLEDLEKLGLRGVKFIPVSIDEYIVGTPRRFDIIYIDACGPLPSDGQKTTRLLVDIFKHGALAPLGVLVTNFSKPDVSKSHTLDSYAFLVAAYLFSKGFMEGENGHMVEGPPVHGFLLTNTEEPDECFLTAVKNDFEEHYGAFITRHILDIASIIAPTVRLTSSKLYQVLFDADIKKATERGRRFARFKSGIFDASLDEEESNENFSSPSDDDIEMDGDAIIDPDMFSLIWTMAACGLYEVDINFDVPNNAVKKFARRWKNQLAGVQRGVIPPEDLIAAFYAWRNDPTLWSPAMKEIINFPYRDIMPFLCDVPTHEIGFYPAFAQLAYPAHGNIRETKRFRYVAEGKTTPMFMDVIAFDECRYVYDWLSAIHLVADDWFDLSSQLTFRFALDAIVKDRRWFGDDFLYGCHVVGINNDFPASEIEQRIDLSTTSKG